MNQQATSQQVKDANRRLYDTVAERYEEIDGRRKPGLAAYLRDTLQKVRSLAPGGDLLDLGCGSGFLADCARGVFEHRVGVDISPEILRVYKDRFDETRAGDVDAIPYPDQCFDAVGCFAVLHHLAEDGGLVREVARILRPGGVFYADHDMDSRFHRRWRWPLSLYRCLRGADASYREAGVEEEDYHLAEVREDGVDAGRLTGQLNDLGFRVETCYHWYGLTGPTDALFGRRSLPRGWAPILRIIATKERTP